MLKFENIYKDLENKNPLPEGKYKAKVDKCQFDLSKELIRWTFIVDLGDSTRIVHKMSKITEQSLPYVLEDFIKFGLRLKDSNDFPKVCEEVMTMGGDVELFIKPDTYDGKSISKVYINAWKSLDIHAG